MRFPGGASSRFVSRGDCIGGSGFLSSTTGLRRGIGLPISGIETGGLLGFAGRGVGLGLPISGIETGGLLGFAGRGIGLGLTTSGMETGGLVDSTGRGIGLGLTTSGMETGGLVGLIFSGIAGRCLGGSLIEDFELLVWVGLVFLGPFESADASFESAKAKVIKGNKTPKSSTVRLSWFMTCIP